MDYAITQSALQSEFFPLFTFASAGIFFILAVLEPFNYRRSLFTALHIAANVCTLTAHPAQLQPWPGLFIPFTIGLAFHTISTLLIHKQSIDRQGHALSHRVGLALSAWVNITRRPASRGDAAQKGAGSPPGTHPSRLNDACSRIFRCFQLWLAKIAITAAADRVVLSLGVTIFDFRPAMQGLLPAIGTITVKGMILRALFSVYWIWNTYFNLQVGYDVVAMIFICVLQLNQPDEWPALFGNIAEAYSLRRFWGIFWHRLHVVPYLAFMPPIPAPYKRYGRVLKPLWIFALSAVCHAAANWSTTRTNSLRQEFVFFLRHWLVCSVEVAVSRIHFFKAVGGAAVQDRQTEIPASSRRRWRTRALGFFWVWFVFLCTVPAWQYPSIYRVVESTENI